MKTSCDRNTCEKHLLKASFKIMFGLFIIGIGSAMMLKAGMGSTPQATIIEGTTKFFNLDYTMGGLIANIIFFVILIFLDRDLISVGTVLPLFMGFLIEVGTYIIQPLYIENMDIVYKFIFLVLGSIITGIGTGYYVGLDEGVGAIDAIGIVLYRKTKLSLQSSRWITDILIFIIGVLLGGTWGIGTLVSIVLVGPVMQRTIKFMKKHEIN